MMLLEDLTGIRAAIVKEYASVELIKAVVDLRSVKEACEIAEIDLACNIGYEMHTAAMRLCKPGIKEQYIAGVLDGIAASYGSMTSFATILTQHGETLHNHDHSHILEPCSESVGFVYIEKKVGVIVFQSYQRLQVGFVYVHAEDTLGNDDYLLIHTVVFFKKTPELG